MCPAVLRLQRTSVEQHAACHGSGNASCSLQHGCARTPRRLVCPCAGNLALKKHGTSPYLQAFLRYPCGALTLFNYPRALRDLHPTDQAGAKFTDQIDLAATDIWRDRERGIPRYNDFRRHLDMNPMKDWKQLTGGNQVCRGFTQPSLQFAGVHQRETPMRFAAAANDMASILGGVELACVHKSLYSN